VPGDLNYDQVHFVIEAAKIAGFPDPKLISSGSAVAIQFASTLDDCKEKTFLFADFGYLHYSLSLVKFNCSNGKNCITVVGYSCFPHFSVQAVDEACSRLILEKALKENKEPSSELLRQIMPHAGCAFSPHSRSF
jgi:molecular chaperone DnaK (HSP70)